MARQVTEVRISKHHEIMENFRGREARAAAAEAFVLLPSPRGSQKLPGS
jgi:hypothetical protein